MKIQWTDRAPGKIQQFASAVYLKENPNLAELLSSEQADHVAEIFQTPLTGAYNWDYRIQDDRIKKLYELGKELNWNAQLDIDWDQPWPQGDSFIEWMDLEHYEPYIAMDKETRDKFWLHMNAWNLSQFLHGEQGALLVASQLISCAPTYNAKLYAASQTFDEARHVEVFNQYLKQRMGLCYPINANLKGILDKILTDARWDIKFIGMQIIIEGLALSAFDTSRVLSLDPVFKDILYLVTRDEARHVTFGVNYLEQFVRTLSEEERDERALFAYEACVICRERLIPTDVFSYFGWEQSGARKQFLDGLGMSYFRKLLFKRVIPNLVRIGLMTEKVRSKFAALELLEYENLATDGDIDWAVLSRPLNTQEGRGEQSDIGDLGELHTRE